MESSEDSVPAPDDGLDLDPRVAALRQRLNEALLEVDQGEYFRSRVHGWLAYRDDAQVQFPESLASRLTSPFTFERPEQPAETSTLDAFMLAYHAAETFCRQAIAFVDGSGPKGAPLIALAELKAGSPFNDRLTALVALPDRDLTEVLDFLFLPPELQATWSDDEEALTLQSVQEYLRLWFRALLRYTADWRNPYNAAKHGLAVGARPTHLSLFADDASVARPMTLMDGPTLTTVEHEPVRDSQGKGVKRPDGTKAVRWFWMYRAVDPEELITQTIITADLLDWLRAIGRGRLLGGGQWVKMRAEPKPLDIQRRTSPGTSFRVELAASPLPPEQAESVLSRYEGD